MGAESLKPNLHLNSRTSHRKKEQTEFKFSDHSIYIYIVSIKNLQYYLPLKWLLATFFSKEILGLSVRRAEAKKFFCCSLGYFFVLFSSTVWYFCKSSSGAFSLLTCRWSNIKIDNFGIFKITFEVSQKIPTLCLI